MYALTTVNGVAVAISSSASEVVGSMLTTGKCLCDKHENFQVYA